MNALRDAAKKGFVVVGLVLMLLWPALWNRAPLFYYDSVDYLQMPFTGQLPVFRTAPYGWFQWFARLTDSLWLPVVLQALLVAAMVWLSARSFMRDLKPSWFLAGMAILCLATGWPWYVSQIMADSVTGAVLLAAVALCCGEPLPRWQHWTLIALTALGISFHLSHLAVICGLCIAAALGWLLTRWRPDWPQIRVAGLAMTALLAIVVAVVSNYAATGRVFLFRDPANLRLALFVETGLVQKYLEDVCPGNEKASLLCPYRQRLPRTANAYLWNTFGPFHELGGWRSEAHKQEAKVIVHEIITRYPLETAWRLGHAALVQFGMVQTGDGIRPMHWHLEKPIRQLYYEFLDDFLDAHQQQEVIDFGSYAARDSILYWTTLLAMVFFAIGRWLGGVRWPGTAALFILFALMGNAIVCGAFSNPNHRYQGRIAWLPMLMVLLVSADAVAARRRTEGPEAAGEHVVEA